MENYYHPRFFLNNLNQSSKEQALTQVPALLKTG